MVVVVNIFEMENLISTNYMGQLSANVGVSEPTVRILITLLVGKIAAVAVFFYITSL